MHFPQSKGPTLLAQGGGPSAASLEASGLSASLLRVKEPTALPICDWLSGRLRGSSQKGPHPGTKPVIALTLVLRRAHPAGGGEQEEQGKRSLEDAVGQEDRT